MVLTVSFVGGGGGLGVRGGVDSGEEDRRGIVVKGGREGGCRYDSDEFMDGDVDVPAKWDCAVWGNE